MRSLLGRPVVVAPMAGGPSTPALVAGAAAAGGFGFLAGGYKTAGALRDDMEAVRAMTPEGFGVNLFVPGAPTREPERVEDYVRSLEDDAADLGVALGEPRWDDDGWDQKVEGLLADPPAAVSFTFGCPPRETVEAFRAAGSTVVVTVTCAREAAAAAGAGADGLCVQGPEAGGHRGTFSPIEDPTAGRDLRTLVRDVSGVTELPLLAAGGIMSAAAVAVMVDAGALAVQCGTAFLRCPESGAGLHYKAALADARFTSTAVTRSFSGRPARGLVNRFVRAHPDAPAAYPEVNNATRPLRAAAGAKGDLEHMSLWAGTGYRSALERPVGEIVEMLSAG